VNEEKLTVLIVDDDAVDRLAVRRLLAAASGFAVEEAEDAASGLGAMQTGRCDAILLDYSLPARDGASILREAIDLGVKAPILVLTGHGDEQLAVELLRTGAADYIPKASLKNADLPQRIRQLVRLVRAQQEAKRVQQSLQDRVEFEQQLIGVVSHDLRNPLSTIRLSAQVLRSKMRDEAQKAVLERIIRATGQADRMIRDLLDFTQARLGTGIPVDPTPIDFHEVVRQVLGDLRIAHPDRDLRLEQTGPGAGAWDAGRLAQLTMNLVGNAYQHSPEGTPVQVVTAVGADGGYLRVTNIGPPIPVTDIPRLFEPLRRGRSLSSNITGSIGLGLFISQEIARAHGGAITVVSSEKSTTFTAHLPSRQAIMPEAARAAES
jgi:signal transduction histidine kinase